MVGDGKIDRRPRSGWPPPTFRVWLAALGLALAGIGCGTDEAIRSEVVERLGDAYPEASIDQAGCVADRLADRYGFDSVRDLLGSGDADFEENEYRDLFACGVVGDLRATLDAEIDNVGVGQAERECVSQSFLESLNDENLDSLLAGELSDEVIERFGAALTDCGVFRLS